MFRALFETHLHVADLERSMEFYGDVLGLKLGLYERARRAAFYWIGQGRKSMLGLWEQPPWAAKTKTIARQHIAFEVAARDLKAAIRRVRERGMETRDFHEKVTSIPSTFRWIPARSIYFDDPDGHLLELIARPGNFLSHKNRGRESK
jgi:catechol 2,3-dioxygenase-like lactoylglutathione lyase family enzyme